MKRLGLFQFAGFRYAVPLPRLLRVVHRCRCFPLPRLPHGVMSVLVDESRLVPLLNLHELLFAHGAAATSADYVVLIESEAGRIALPADTTSRIVPEAKGRIISLDETDAAAKSGEFHYQRNRFAILDVDNLIMSLLQTFGIPEVSSPGAGGIND